MCYRPPKVKNGTDSGELPPPKPPVIPGFQNLPSLTVAHPDLPGAKAIRTNLVGATINDAAVWRILKKGVVSRPDQIDCWYESPVTALIQDAQTKAIVGVEIERDGKKLNIAARNGVVMALGGYENNQGYLQQFTGQAKALPVGTLYNEGDGMRMAQAAGAKMWHLNAWESSGIGLVPEEDRRYGLGDIPFFKEGSVLLVGGDARRYLAEDLEQKYGRVLVGGTWVMPMRPERSYFIFDEAQRQAVASGEKAKPYPSWSDDFSEEIEKGKIIQAESLDALALVLALDAEALRTTVDAYNQGAASGNDVLGRKPESMRAFGEGPYYGIAMFPAVISTQGGPERTARAEVLDTNDRPLPHLYSAGEFGGITARRYQGGGNLSECIVFGKIAGEQAAQEKDDALDPRVPTAEYGPGSGMRSVYDWVPDEAALGERDAYGCGDGLGGPMWVKVSTSSRKLTKVEVLKHCEASEEGGTVLDELVRRVVKSGSTNVDVVSGATVTSLGFLAAVEKAVEKLREAKKL